MKESSNEPSGCLPFDNSMLHYWDGSWHFKRYHVAHFQFKYGILSECSILAEMFVVVFLIKTFHILLKLLLFCSTFLSIIWVFLVTIINVNHTETENSIHQVEKWSSCDLLVASGCLYWNIYYVSWMDCRGMEKVGQIYMTWGSLSHTVYM